MWRRWGDYLYALMVLVVFGAEASALVALSVGFLARLFGLLPYTRLLQLLTAVVLLTCVSLAVVMQHVLLYYAASAWHERTRKERAAHWTDLLVRWLFDRSVPLPNRLPREGAEALLDLRETVKGEDGRALADLVTRFSIDRRLVQRARARSLGGRLQAIEGLAKARLPSALPAAYQLLDDPSPVVRYMATRVIARTLADMPADAARDREVRRFVEVLRTTDLPSGVVEESLLLLDDAALPVVRALLTAPETRAKVSRAALEAAGRLDLRALAPAVLPYIEDPNPELRAAALQCVPRLHASSPALADAITRASEGPLEFVRVQATHALSSLEPARALPTLWNRLEDASWWVRRAAAEALAALGPLGRAELERVVESHPDKYARQMARHVLQEAP
jgi:HEAT repeat protein